MMEQIGGTPTIRNKGKDNRNTLDLNEIGGQVWALRFVFGDYLETVPERPNFVYDFFVMLIKVRWARGCKQSHHEGAQGERGNQRVAVYADGAGSTSYFP